MRRNTILCLSALTLAAGLLTAGPLSPPAGPVASTFRTLGEIEPRTPLSAATTPGDGTAVYVITQPGSYYLTGPIAVPSGKSGVRITATNVTLDLSGFAVTGQAGSVDGIVSTGTAKFVNVRNGLVSSMGQMGVDLSFLSNNSLSHVTVSGCGGHGIEIASASIIDSCTVETCQRGIYTGYDTSVRGCTVRECGDIGYVVQQGSTLENCTATFNTGPGYWVMSGALLRGCMATTNFTNGFVLSDNATALDCSAYENTGDGFNAGPGCRVERCAANGNSGDGFEAATQSAVRGCTARSNGGAGVLLTAAYASAEGNTCGGNDLYGVRTTSSGALVVRNTVVGGIAGSTNYSLAAGTRYGAIVNTAGSAAATTVNPGGSAAASFSTTDPNANLSY
jgi:hypothetical protein